MQQTDRVRFVTFRDAFYVSLTISVITGLLVGFVKFGPDLKETLLTVFLTINEIFLMLFLYLLAFLFLFRLLKRWISGDRKAAFTANAIVLVPLFGIWSYRMNVLELPGFFSSTSILWNIFYSAAFVFIWILIPELLFRWSQSRSSRANYVKRKSSALFWSLLITIALLQGWRAVAASSANHVSGPEIVKSATTASPDDRVYIFGEHLNDVVKLESAAPMASPSSWKLDFDAKDTQIDKTQSGFEIHDLKIPAQNIFGISIRMKIKNGEYFDLRWKMMEETGFSPKHKTRIKIPSRNEFVSYKIATENLRGWSSTLDKIRVTSLVAGEGGVELDAIHFLTVHQFFSEKAGTESFELDSEVRSVIYTHAPSHLQYKMLLPRRPFLTFGMAIADPAIPTEFEIRLMENGKQESIFVQRVNEKKWSDAEIDLTKWEGKEVTISFDTRSAGSGSLAFWANPGLHSATTERPNVVLYLIDCLRPDHIGAYGYTRNATPNIDSFAKNAILFRNAHSQFTATRASVTSLFTSQYFSAHGVGTQIHQKLAEGFVTIAEELRDHGYETVSFLENGNAGPLANLDQGFESIHLNGLSGEGNRFGSVASVGHWLHERSQKNRNFFLYLHSLELHEPYIPPEPYRSMFLPDAKSNFKDLPMEAQKLRLSEKETARMIAVYDGALKRADERFGKFLHELKATGSNKNTIVILIADHGELFGEHKLWSHGVDPYQLAIRVPLLIGVAGRQSETIATENVQLIDIAPTILDLAGIRQNPDFQGNSLLPFIAAKDLSVFHHRDIYSEGLDWKTLSLNSFRYSDRFERVALIHGSWKGIFNKYENRKSIFQNYFPMTFDFFRITRDSLYNLQNDPAERSNVIASEFELQKQLKIRLDQWLARQKSIHREKTGASGKENMMIDPQAVEELEALGYVQ